MIYFDNAATGGFKPFKCIDTAFNAMKNLNANAGRSGHKLSNLASEIIYDTRKSISDFFDADGADRVVFTQNCTTALNTAIFGLYKKGGKVITTALEHNSVLRPLYELKRRGEITLSIIYPKAGGVSAEEVYRELTPDTSLVVASAVSNVTGQENDINGIGKLLQKTETVFIVDGAQSAGHTQISVNNQLIDALCVAGHKGLLSVQGVGALIFSKKARIRPLTFGGTGSNSFSKEMPEDFPERLEAGTLNLPAICSLKAGIDHLNENISYVSNQLLSLTEYLVSKLSTLPFIALQSIPNKYGIVSFTHSEIPSQELAEILSEKYDIAVRGGFHCAPLTHKFLKTHKLGTVRVSLAPQNTRREINFLITALKETVSMN